MSEMTLMRAITERHAVRSYTDQIVDERTVRTLLDAAVRAPTAIHAEPWAFAIVQDKRLLAQLSERAKSLIAQSNDPHAKALASLLAQPGFNIFYDAGTLIVIGARPTNEFAVADLEIQCPQGFGAIVETLADLGHRKQRHLKFWKARRAQWSGEVHAALRRARPCGEWKSSAGPMGMMPNGLMCRWLP